jgi:uncharacterized damage-inducible protein DinB
MSLDSTTLAALAAFPAQLEAHFGAVPAAYRQWTPPDWNGIPSESFTALEQVCHVCDIEVAGYHVRFARTLREDAPFLPSIDSEARALEHDYAKADAANVFAAFRAARQATVAMLADLDDAQLARPATFEGYGETTLRGLVHYLCSHDQHHLAGLQWLLGRIAQAIPQPAQRAQ